MSKINVRQALPIVLAFVVQWAIYPYSKPTDACPIEWCSFALLLIASVIVIIYGAVRTKGFLKELIWDTTLQSTVGLMLILTFIHPLIPHNLYHPITIILFICSQAILIYGCLKK